MFAGLSLSFVIGLIAWLMKQVQLSCAQALWIFIKPKLKLLWVWAELWTPYKFCEAKFKHSRLGSAWCDYSLIYYLQWCKKSAFLSSRQARAELWTSYYSCLSNFKHSILGSAWLDLSLIYYPHRCKLLWFLFSPLWFVFLEILF